MKTTFKFSILLSTFIFLSTIWNPCSASKTGNSPNNVDLVWNISGELQAQEAVFISTFYEAYKHFSTSDLHVKDKYFLIKNGFNEEKNTLNKDPENTKWVSAFLKNGTVVGYASFDIHRKTKEVYIRQLAVHPEHWGQGIGRKLVFSIREQYPAAEKLTMITRKINTDALSFYKHIGFTETAFMHEGYDKNLYTGLEIALKS